MRATNWTATTSDRAVALRAGGRRRYNAERQAARERRRCAIAALLARDGRVFQGCNVENAAYGLCNCAERTALFSAVAQGYKPGDFAALAVVGDTEGPIAPCGACRQVMIELGTPALPVFLGNMKSELEVTTAGALLPGAFYLPAAAPATS